MVFRGSLFSVLFVALAFFASTAQADSIQYDFSGTLTVQDDPGGTLSAIFSNGQLVTGSFRIDDTGAVDGRPLDTEWGLYSGASDIVVHIGGFTWTTTGGTASVFDDRPGTGDAFSVNADGTTVGGPGFGSLVPQTLFVQGFDPGGTVFATDGLGEMFDIEFSDFSFFINGMRLGNPGDSNDFGVLRWSITSLDAVPEPATILLIALAGGAFALRRRRRRA